MREEGTGRLRIARGSSVAVLFKMGGPSQGVITRHVDVTPSIERSLPPRTHYNRRVVWSQNAFIYLAAGAVMTGVGVLLQRNDYLGPAILFWGTATCLFIVCAPRRAPPT